MVSALTALRHPAPKVEGLCAGRYELEVCAPEPDLETYWPRLTAAATKLIYTSPSQRCRCLAESISARLRLPVTCDARLLELNFGCWEGLKWSDIRARDAERFANWGDNWLTASPPDGESLPQLERRVVSFLNDLSPEPALVITHAGPIRAMLVKLRGISWEQAMSIAIPYATPVPLE